MSDRVDHETAKEYAERHWRQTDSPVTNLCRAFLAQHAEIKALRRVRDVAEALVPDLEVFMPAIPSNDKLRKLSERGAALVEALTATRTGGGDDTPA